VDLLEHEFSEQQARQLDHAVKGFSANLLDEVVETITANRDRWLSTMMDEELHLQPVQTPTSSAARS
jgi:hypothetical protein